MTLTRRSPGAHADRDDATRAPTGDRKEEQHHREHHRSEHQRRPPRARCRLRRHLPGGPRHRPGGDGRREPRARRALAQPRLPDRRGASALRHRGGRLGRAIRCRRRPGARRGAPTPMLVAGADAPALEGVRAELELAVSVTRVLDEVGDSTHLRAAARRRGRARDRAVVRGPRARAPGASSRSASPSDWPTWSTRRPSRTRASRSSTFHSPTRCGSSPTEGCGVVVAERVLADAVAEAPRLGERGAARRHRRARRRRGLGSSRRRTAPATRRPGTAWRTRARCCSRRRCCSRKGSDDGPQARRWRRA